MNIGMFLSNGRDHDTKLEAGLSQITLSRILTEWSNVDVS